MNLIRKFRSLYWTYYIRLHGGKVGKGLTLLGPLDLLLRDDARFSNITIGDNVTFGGKVYIRIRKNGKLILGNNVRTGPEVWLVTANDSKFIVGENSILGSYTIINGGHGITIGSNCLFAAFVYINTSEHGFKKNEIIQKQDFYGFPITIGDDVWIGGHTFINKGLSLGTGSVIGAGSVVTKDISDYKIVIGNPATVIKNRE